MIKKSTDVSLTLLNKCNSSIDHCRTVPWKEYLLSVGCLLSLAFFSTDRIYCDNHSVVPGMEIAGDTCDVQDNYHGN